MYIHQADGIQRKILFGQRLGSKQANTITHLPLSAQAKREKLGYQIKANEQLNLLVCYQTLGQIAQLEYKSYSTL